MQNNYILLKEIHTCTYYVPPNLTGNDILKKKKKKNPYHANIISRIIKTSGRGPNLKSKSLNYVRMCLKV